MEGVTGTYIRQLIVQNWKCWLQTRTFTFDQLQIINRRNGTGKTSLFEAITFAIWGKTPVGFNMNTVRNDDSKMAMVDIYFELNGDDVRILRKFPISSVSELYVNGQLVAESVRSIEQWMNERISYAVVSQLWTNNLIQSDLLQATFFTKTILEDKLGDPNKLLAEYRAQVRQLKTERSKITLDTSLPNEDEVRKQLAEIEAELQKGVVNQRELALARLAKDAANVSDPFPELSTRELSDILARCQKIIKKDGNLASLREQLEAETKKTESLWSKYPQTVIRQMLANSHGHCELCKKRLSEPKLQGFISAIDSGGRSEDRITYLRESILLLAFWESKLEKVSAVLSSRKTISDCPNWKEVLDRYDADNESKWNKYRELQGTLERINRNNQNLKRIKQIDADVADATEKGIFLSDYVKQSTSYWTNSILERASGTLQTVNGRYQQAVLYENNLHILVEDERHSLTLLPVQRLSNGEKTLVALSILFAIHSLFVPEIPLLFDEAFSALDKENLAVVQTLIRNHNGQIFIITHDGSWNHMNGGE